MANEVRVRFAPSPTGYLHVGGARTALFNYLFARHNNGKFILRIEDTDRSRFKEGALEEIFTSLRWLGLDWDEGPENGGDYGPYFQSERTDLYKKMADYLIEKGDAYYCFCTSKRLTQVREEQQKNKCSITGYDRHCRDLSREDVKKQLDAGTPCVVRFKVPLDREITFNDAIRGDITFQCKILDDLVLLKSDGFPTYHMANVVDDHNMKISHVLRGDEWIASAPRHLLIYEAFGWEPPILAHMPVILSPTGGKLSKRKGAASVMDYKKAGYLSDALFNFLALLGWSPGDDKEKMSLDEMIELFTLGRVSPKGAVFDEQKLEWMNGLYMQETPTDNLMDEVISLLEDKGVSVDTYDSDYRISVIELLKVRSKKITELVDNAVYFFKDPDTYEEKAVKKRWKGDAPKIMQDLADRMEKCETFTKKSLEAVYQSYIDETELSGGKLIHPTRLAVSGVSFGPGLFELLAILGKETVVRRMRKAVEWIGCQ